ncbi:TPA: hypothetical protein ACIS4Z_004269, partial [Salmonella enterica subsp. enterica serovar Liverpool]
CDAHHVLLNSHLSNCLKNKLSIISFSALLNLFMTIIPFQSLIEAYKGLQWFRLSLVKSQYSGYRPYFDF